MALSDVVSSSITRETQTISRVGYGTPLLCAYHTKYLDRVREYAQLSEMVSDGFSSTDQAYKMAAEVFAQNPRPKTVKIGRRAGAPAQTFRITPLNTTVGYVYSFDFISPAGVSTTVTYTNDASPTIAEAVSGLQAAIDALAGITAVTGGPNLYVDVTVTAAGDLWQIANAPDRLDCEILNTTANPVTTIQTDLAAILLADPDWYGLAIDSQSPAEIAAAAAWTESNKKLFGYETGDSDCADGASTTDIAYTLQALDYARTFGIFIKGRSGAYYAGAAALGRMLPTIPGSATWKFKTLPGTSTDAYTATERSALVTKSINVYDTNAGVSYFAEGVTASGEFIDVTHGTDALNSDIQERVFGTLVRRDKVDFEPAGVEVIASDVRAALLNAQKNRFIAQDRAPSTPAAEPVPGFYVTVPEFGDISDNDKAARTLSSIAWEAKLSGAIHTVSISGRLTL